MDEWGRIQNILYLYATMWHFNILSQSEWFTAHPRMMLPDPLLSPIKEFFLSWWRKAYDSHMMRCPSWTQWMLDISTEDCSGWTKKIISRCIWRKDIRCSVIKNLWPNVKGFLYLWLSYTYTICIVNMCDIILHCCNYFSFVLCTWKKKPVEAFLIHFCDTYCKGAQSTQLISAIVVIK